MSSWSLKKSFWKKNCPINGNENFSVVRVSMVLGLLARLSQNHEVQKFIEKEALREKWEKFFMTLFEFIGQFFL
jgi:hypothetical protein